MKLNILKRQIKSLILIFSLLLCFFYIRSINDRDEKILKFTSFFAPFQKKLSDLAYFFGDMKSGVGDFFSTYADNKLLKEENLRLNEYYYQSQLLQKENEELRKALNFIKNHDNEFISAEIIARTNSSNTQRIFIDKGKNNELKKGLLVFYNEQLVGRVVEVEEKTAVVLLLNDDMSSIPAMTLETKIRCIAAGIKNLNIICKYVDDLTEIIQGELVVTSDDSVEIPPNKIIGNIFYQNNQYFIKPLYDFSKIRFVKIML